MGGVLRLFAIPPTDLTVSGNTVSILSDENMVMINPVEDTASLNETEKETTAGKAYQVDIAATLASDSDELKELIADMERQSKYCVIVHDGNDNYKLAGTPAVPLRFSARSATGASAFALNCYVIGFSGLQLKRAPFVTASVKSAIAALVAGLE